ncbi:MAG: tRNA 2-thiouridine(34) synthase MnmA [Candidatus Moranbacteria bacterium]|nr:tRNA 2-thiouridine(34) synthase MnmA [Candidatus Moranbacteria bacterium]
MAKKPRVIVGMSSGVDSSVAAALLKKQGFDVVGVFMHFWKEPTQDSLIENKCCSLESLEDARKVCQILGIPLYTANAEKEFKKEVVDYFLQEYAEGRTPNPCVACNEHIKFHVLMKKMLEMEGDYIASGHYSINEMGKDGKYHLFQGKDEEKDQSYFLYNFNQKQLAKILFPVGKYKKLEIRKIAEKLKLPVFNKDDSQGLCFTPEKYPENFLRRNLQLKKGKIQNTAGKVVGEHDGLPLYTIGQRRGINIGGDGPYFVVGKDLTKNILIVTNDEKDPNLVCSQMQVEKVNWIVSEPKLPLKILVKTRYRHQAVSAIIESVERGTQNVKRKMQDAGRSTINDPRSTYTVVFDEPQRAISPGQSAVFYTKQGEMIGGGRII